MSISNSLLAAFNAGISTRQEDKLVLNELIGNENLSELLDIVDEVDSIEGLDELRKEFNETIDNQSDFNEFNINVK